MKSKLHLFPHSYLPERVIKRLVSLFGPVTFYMPWFMDAPIFFRDYELEIIYPPGDNKPAGDFKTILSGYRAWAEQDHDRSRREILKYSGGALPDDSATWDIRRLLKGAAYSVTAEGEDLTLKHHLLLHLASETERRHFEIMEMIKNLKEKGSVLAGALQDPSELQGVFADADDTLETGIPDNMNVQPLLDAWFGLFSGYIGECDMLVTCSRRVMDYLSSEWDDRDSEGETRDTYSISFNLPDTSSERYKEGIEKIRELILVFGEDPGHYMSEFQGLLKGFESTFPWGSSEGFLKLQIRHFPLMPGGMSFKTDDLLRHVAGKTLILMSLF